MKDIGLKTSGFRIDAEYYSRDNLGVAEMLALRQACPITDFVDVSDGNHMGISDEFLPAGIPYYRGGEVKSFFMEMTLPLHRIPEEVFSRAVMRRSHLRKGDVLVTIVGTIGSVATVVTDDKAICSCKIAILRPHDVSLSAYIGTFLRTRYGQSQVHRLTRGSVQLGFVLDDFSLLQIPMFSAAFRALVHGVVERAHRAGVESGTAMKEAEQMLLSELGFDGWAPTEESVSVKNCSDFMSVGRFDAEYFQPKYDEIVAKIKTYSGGTIKAASVLITGLVNESEDTPERYVELADIGVSGEIEGCTNAMFGELPSRARQRMATGQVIASSIEGSLDRCALVTPEYDKALCSTGFHRFSSQDINPETMLLLFKSWPIQQLMKRGCSGTILCGILPGELVNVPLPLVASKVQRDLAAKVQSSFALRAESKRLLDLAKHAVELAIEQGEDNAINVVSSVAV